tara:strand:- start:673 stop:1050 length:378 start_codon:yes stop_codon:yes gene_type:complete
MAWKNFKLEEFACRHCGENNISHELINKLQGLRTELGFPFVITSGYRCKNHDAEKNKPFPGTHNSGIAVDILCKSEEAFKIVTNASKHGFTGIGVSQKGKLGSRFIHLDIGTKKGGKLRPTIWSY